MGIINYSAQVKLLTVARGHPYDREAFAALFEDLAEFDVCHAEQPEAAQLFHADACARYAAIVCYDMPGVDFTSSPAPGFIAPDEAFKKQYLAMLNTGIGMVFLHHSIAAWPAWPEYAEIVGGRFHYTPAALRDKQWPDSGYRHQVKHQVRKVLEHPVTQGIPESFAMTDELYLCPIFEEDVTPLLRSDYDFTLENFYSAKEAVAGSLNSREGWTHPAGSNLVGWVKRWGKSPIVYLQGGDDATAMANPHFRRLVSNAVRWVSSPQAKTWATTV